jgi:hypothetical protein
MGVPPDVRLNFFSGEDLNKGHGAALEEAQKVFAAAHDPDTGTNP